MRAKLILLFKTLNWPILFFWSCSMGASALNWVFNLILVRILNLAEFGVISFMMTVQLIISVFSVGILTTTNKFAADYLLGSTKRIVFPGLLRWSWIFGFFSALALLWGSQVLNSLFQIPHSFLFTLMMSLMLLLLFPLSWSKGIINAKQAYIWAGVVIVIESLTKVLLAFVSQFTTEPLLTSAAAITGSMAVALILGFWLIQQWRLPITPGTGLRLPREVQFFYINSIVWGLGTILPFTVDMLMVKHFFPPNEAGLYATAALVGKVMFFINYSIVGILIPVLSAQIAAKKVNPLLMPLTMGTIIGVTAISCLTFYLFPQLSLRILLGDNYLAAQPLSILYTMAAGFVGIAAVFSTYHLIWENYLFPLMSLCASLFEIVLIFLFHDSLLQVLTSIVVVSVILSLAMLYVHIQKFFLAKRSLFFRSLAN